jgi:hypothetical protein
MPQLVRGNAQIDEFVEKLKSIQPLVPPGVVRWRYTFDDDWSGDPAVYFWVLLTDEASQLQNLEQVATAFENAVTESVDPLNEWGLFPYFHFRSESEQAQLKGAEYE